MRQKKRPAGWHPQGARRTTRMGRFIGDAPAWLGYPSRLPSPSGSVKQNPALPRIHHVGRNFTMSFAQQLSGSAVQAFGIDNAPVTGRLHEDLGAL
jgi:hypothetical protein